MLDLPIVPGRGLNAYSAIKDRQAYLSKLGFSLNNIQNTTIEPEDIRSNIESFVGSVEVPLGIVGPLLYNNKTPELVYTLAATLEGALIASMNRGAKALSKSGGFSAFVKHQRMIRAPMFIFQKIEESLQFRNWIPSQFETIKKITQEHSNHAQLEKIEVVMMETAVHLRFIYQTGDAAGQNMTTSCTWHAMLWLVEAFKENTQITIEHYVIEGNGASDKKVSKYAMEQGRGIHVVAHCTLKEDVLRKVLRTDSDALLRFFHPSVALSKIDGMHGYNINVANVIAAIFLATGQDMASVHESSTGILQLVKTADGLDISLCLPSLVIGTLGGGTHLNRQQEALDLMDCNGNGKINRFAEMIAGFALALEISTYAAIVSGEFAKAHEKLGRNKPVNWLTRAELTHDFLHRILKSNIKNIHSIQLLANDMIDNGIIMNLTNRVSKKMIGFIPLEVTSLEGDKLVSKKIILKSKALDIEVIKGLHAMAASIDIKLSDLLKRYKGHLEYTLCHKKEMKVYDYLHYQGFDCMPQYFGQYTNEKREIYIFAQEFLEEKDLIHINTQKTPERWNKTQIEATIKSLTVVHRHFEDKKNQQKLLEITAFEPWKAAPLYRKLVTIMLGEEDNGVLQKKLSQLLLFIDILEAKNEALKIPLTVIHNDCNSRNIAIRKDNRPCIYDWELAVLDVPHRDIVELLSFVLKEDFPREEFLSFLRYHYSFYPEYDWADWCDAYVYSIKVYLITRISFYEVAGVLDRYAFSKRIMNNAFRMLGILNELTSST